MTKGRMEAFSDGVLAIVITIMVLEMKVPHEASWHAMRPLLPVFLSYVLSFVFLGIYWNNHHHLLQAVRHVNGGILWANLHLLFWLSLIPFVTGWMGENHFAATPVALYAFVLLMAGTAYFILVNVLISHHGPESHIAKAIAGGWKEKLSLALYIISIPMAFVHPLISCAIFVAVAVLWLIPDRRIERTIIKHGEG
jgi:uncharacterized membrane protein